MTYKEAFDRGQATIAKSQDNCLEIFQEIDSFARQLESLASLIAKLRPATEREDTWYLGIAQEPGSQWHDISTVRVPRSGYPCTIRVGQYDRKCACKADLESAFREILTDEETAACICGMMG